MSNDPGPRYSYAIAPDARLALGRMFGTVDGDDMLEMVSAVYHDKRWRPEFDVIWDCSRVAAHVVLPDDVTPIIDEASEAMGRGVLIESPSVGGELIAELLAMRSRIRGNHVVVCKTMEAALSALGHASLPAELREPGL